MNFHGVSKISFKSFAQNVVAGWLLIEGFAPLKKRVQGMIDTFSRKPAARIGEVFFANKVSLGGLGAEIRW